MRESEQDIKAEQMRILAAYLDLSPQERAARRAAVRARLLAQHVFRVVDTTHTKDAA